MDNGDNDNMNRLNKFNGERLKNARLYRGKTLTDVSKDTGISKQSLSLYENNKNMPELANVMKLLQVLDFPYDFFFQESSFQVKTESTYFRALLSATKKERTAQSVKLEYLAQIYLVLFEYIDFPRLNLPKIDFQGGNISYEYEDANEVEQLEAIAMEVREYWGLGTTPISDLRFILEANGIIVTGFDSNAEKIDAFSQRTIVNNEDIFFIAISKTGQTVARARFDMAHELAHILLHPWSEDLELVPKEEFKARERQANILASTFLLPRDGFIQDVSHYPTNLEYYKHLKEKWNVSIQAMIYRAHQLEILTSNQYQYLMRQISKNGWRGGEPGDVPYVLKDNLLRSAVDMLIKNNVLNGAEIVEELNNYGIAMHAGEIEELLCLKAGTLSAGKTERPNLIQLKIIEREKRD